METQISNTEKPAKKNQNLLIIASIVIAFCCCFLVLASLGIYAYQTYRSNQQLWYGPIEGSTPIPPNLDSSTASPGDDVGLDEAPAGGLGNEVLRNDTWQVIRGAAIGRGCDQPIGAKSTIEVLQEPDNNGIWFEKWTVACQSGDSYAFEVQFVLDSTGATFNIRSLP